MYKVNDIEVILKDKNIQNGIFHCTKRFYHKLDKDIITQCVYEGTWKAVKNFDNKLSSFSTYLFSRIRFLLRKELAKKMRRDTLRADSLPALVAKYSGRTRDSSLSDYELDKFPTIKKLVEGFDIKDLIKEAGGNKRKVYKNLENERRILRKMLS